MWSSVEANCYTEVKTNKKTKIIKLNLHSWESKSNHVPENFDRVNWISLNSFASVSQTFGCCRLGSQQINWPWVSCDLQYNLGGWWFFNLTLPELFFEELIKDAFYHWFQEVGAEGLFLNNHKCNFTTKEDLMSTLHVSYVYETLA
jgi:hypothetical protein